jgi:Domain of unknown function (DUF6484)
MPMKERHTAGVAVEAAATAVADLAQLLAAPVDTHAGATDGTRIDGVLLGTLVGFADDGATPLITYRRQPGTAALPARATVDLHSVHVGRDAVLMFEDGDPYRPIVVGCLRNASMGAPRSETGQIEVDADGKRLIVSAEERIVLRCGKASITLTKEGKILVQGAYVSNQSSGVLRIKGGSVQIN